MKKYTTPEIEYSNNFSCPFFKDIITVSTENNGEADIQFQF